MRTKYIVILCLLTIFCACRQELIEVEELNNGTLYRTFTINKDSLLHGRYLSYFEDGTSIFEESYYEDGKLEGKRIIYYQNGQPEIIETYENDLLSDTLYVFYEGGQIKQKVPYRTGALTGEVSSFYINGVIKERVMFSDNIEQGAFEEYFENGQPKWRGQYLNGANEFGELQKFDSTGTLIRRLMCDSIARCTTVWSIEDTE